MEMKSAVTPASIAEITPALVEAIYEITIGDNLPLAHGLIERATGLLETLSAGEEVPEFMGKIQNRDEMVGLLVECIVQQIDAMRTLFENEKQDVPAALAGHVVKLRQINSFVEKQMKERGK